MSNHGIPLVLLNTEPAAGAQHTSQTILKNEINGIRVERVVIAPESQKLDSFEDGNRTVYLFIKGTGVVSSETSSFDIVPESIYLPNIIDKYTIKSSDDDALVYLKIVCKLSNKDHVDLNELPIENTQNSYFAKFEDCQPYTEEIKSPNTISRTILSNEYIPRVAMGTVRTEGPDKVAAHEHPMLEQLFLGLSGNDCIVYADDNKVSFPQYSVVHIPLGSSHSVSVDKDKLMYYVWMDFFLDKKGEDWLKTHKTNE